MPTLPHEVRLAASSLAGTQTRTTITEQDRVLDCRVVIALTHDESHCEKAR